MSSALSYGVWALILAAGLTLWGLSSMRAPKVARPSAIVARLAVHPVWRVVLVLGFMWLGWHLFAR